MTGLLSVLVRSWFSYTIQSHLPKSSTIYSWLNSLTKITSSEYVPETCSQDHLNSASTKVLPFEVALIPV